MNRKISLGLALSLIIMTAAASFAVTMAYSQKIFNNLLPDLSQRLERRYELDEIEGIVTDQFYFQADINEKALTASIAAGYIAGLNNDYCRYLTAAEYAEYTDKVEGKIHGIGIIPVLNADTGFIYVSAVAPGSPAAGAGIAKGDEIIGIGNETVNGGNYETMIKKLQGRSLENVTLTFRRAGADKTVNVIIGYDAQSVAYSMYETTGYIKINSFYKTTAPQLENAIDELTRKNAAFIIFDVRGTSDGTMKYAADTADVIVPIATEATGVIATAFDQKDSSYATFPSKADEVTLPMAVLVDSGTAGCAELFAVSLSDFKKGFILGEKTKGSDLMQEIFPLTDGGAVILPVARIRPYITESFSAGLQPLIEVTLTPEQRENLAQLAPADDPQFLAAYAQLEALENT